MTLPDTPLYHRILVATGGATHSRRAVERAVTLVAHFGAELDIVTVVPFAANTLVNLAAGLPGSEPLEAQTMQDESLLRGST